MIKLVLVGLVSGILGGYLGAKLFHRQQHITRGIISVPSYTGTMPDGTPVQGIVVIPPENILEKSAAWKAFEQQWPSKYILSEVQQ